MWHTRNTEGVKYRKKSSNVVWRNARNLKGREGGCRRGNKYEGRPLKHKGQYEKEKFGFNKIRESTSGWVLWLEGTTSHGQGHLPLEHVAQSSFQPSLELLWIWGIHSFSG